MLAEQGACDHADTAVTCREAVESNHDRLETGTLTVCTLTVCDDVEWLAQRHNRPGPSQGQPGLTAIVMVECRAGSNTGPKGATRHIAKPASTSPPMSLPGPSHVSRAPEMASSQQGRPSASGHREWLAWVLDMVFRDDEWRVRSANAPANFTTIKHMAANLPKTARGKESLRLERRLTAWDEDFLHQALKGK